MALATFVKPFVAVVGAIWLMRRRFKPIGAFIATMGAMIAASAVAFGGRTFLYFLVGDKGVKPNWIYAEPTNQSALGFFHRLLDTGAACTGAHCVLTVPFLAFAATTAALSLLALVRLRRSHDQRGWPYCFCSR